MPYLQCKSSLSLSLSPFPLTDSIIHPQHQVATITDEDPKHRFVRPTKRDSGPLYLHSEALSRLSTTVNAGHHLRRFRDCAAVSPYAVFFQTRSAKKPNRMRVTSAPTVVHTGPILHVSSLGDTLSQQSLTACKKQANPTCTIPVPPSPPPPPHPRCAPRTPRAPWLERVLAPRALQRRHALRHRLPLAERLHDGGQLRLVAGQQPVRHQRRPPEKARYIKHATKGETNGGVKYTRNACFVKSRQDSHLVQYSAQNYVQKNSLFLLGWGGGEGTQLFMYHLRTIILLYDKVEPYCTTRNIFLYPTQTSRGVRRCLLFCKMKNK